MKKFAPLLLALSLVGCALQQPKYYWRVKDAALSRNSTVELQTPNRLAVLTVPTRMVQEIMLAHLRINRAAGVQSELYIVDGEEPNAFAGGANKGQRIISINLGMVRLIGDDVAGYAALIGHEAAHWAKGHVDAGQTRAHTITALGTALGAGLSAAGVPAAGLISGLGVDLINATYSRDQEREADAASVDYLLAGGYDPAAAVRLQEKFLKVDRGLRLPFLSSHPSGEERIANIKTIIANRRAVPHP